MIKLHLGCGKRIAKGMINIDIQHFEGVDIVNDITKNLPFQNESVDLIYNCGVLEHLDRRIVKDTLKYWFNLLKSKGVIQISTVDFEAICKRYKKEKNIEEITGLLVGGSKDWTDRHGIILDMNYLKRIMKEVGFVNIKRRNWKYFEPYKLDKNFDDFSRSYLPHMDFENGDLMVLNIIAIKE